MKDRFDPLALIKEIITLIVVLVVIFGWMMLVQLIISFVALSYVTLKLKTMIIVSVAVAVLFGIIFEVTRIRKRKKYSELIK